jgi:DNA-directed RNA polymerase
MPTQRKRVKIKDGGVTYSLLRDLKTEDNRALNGGYATTRQGRALASDDERVARLTHTIEAWRHQGPRDRNHKKAWVALQGRESAQLAQDLLIAGVTACYSVEAIRRDGEPQEYTFPVVCDWIGHGLGFRKGKTSLLVGALGNDLLATLDDLFEQTDDNAVCLKLSERTDRFLDGVIARGISNNPYIFPMLEPPAPWTQVRRGPFSQTTWASTHILERHASNIAVARKAIEDGRMQPVLDAVNSLGRVPLRINSHVLHFALNRPDVAKPLPREPWLRDRFLRQEAGRLRYHQLNLGIARALDEHWGFYLPYDLDWRGRVYSISHFAYAREDVIRALFEFAEGAVVENAGPIEESDCLYWLKAHIAGMADGNTFSGNSKPSKLSNPERVAWVNANLLPLYYLGLMLVELEESLGANYLYGLDTPCQLMRACVDLVQYDRERARGAKFITHLPLKYDACCSGVGHMAAMVRSLEGRFAKLTPDNSPDLYSVVAEDCFFNNKIAGSIMRGPDDRAIVKQPVMTHYYGSPTGGWVDTEAESRRKEKATTDQPAPEDGRKRKFAKVPVGKTAQIVEKLKERGKSGRGAKYLAAAVTASLRGRAPKRKYRRIIRQVAGHTPECNEVLRFLRHIARVYVKYGKQMRWDTLCGLPVINSYYLPDEQTITTSTLALRKDKQTGERKKVRVRKRMKRVVGDKDDIDKKGAIKGAAPNFVHSIDACFLHMVANACAAEGIPLLPIHDCFSTLAPFAARLNRILREQFIKLHEHDWLADVLERARQELRKDAELPKPLPTGPLELNQVLDAPDMFK